MKYWINKKTYETCISDNRPGDDWRRIRRDKFWSIRSKAKNPLCEPVYEPTGEIELSFSQLGSVGAMIAEEQIEKMAQRIEELEEFVREVAVAPVTAASLETLQKRAATFWRQE